MKKILFDKKTLFLLVIIFLIAVGMRTYFYSVPLLSGPDAYFHARMTEYTITMGDIPKNDPLAYYQLGGAPQFEHTLLWDISATIYKIFFKEFNVDKLLVLLTILPVLFGAITSILFYFFGKELFSKKSGLIMAFVSAITPIMIFNSKIGAFEEEAFAFIPFLAGLTFFFHAIKTDSLNRKDFLFTLLAGISFAVMGLSWKLNSLIPLTIIPFILLFSLIMHYNKKRNVKVFFSKCIITLGIYFFLPLIFAKNLFTQLSTNMSIVFGFSSGILIIILMIVAIMLGFIIAKKTEKIKKVQKNKVLAIAIIIIIVTTIIFAFFILNPNPITDKSNVKNLIGEEAQNSNLFKPLGFNYIFLLAEIIFFAAALKLFERKDSVIYCFVITLLCFFLAWHFSKFYYLVGFTTAISAGFVFELIIKSHFPKVKALGKNSLKKIFLIIFFFILAIGVPFSFYYSSISIPTIMHYPDLLPTCEWIKENTAINSSVFSWWSRGHEIAFLCERKVSSDNRNWPCHSCEPNTNTAKFLIDNNASNAYSLLEKEFYPNYILLYEGMFYELKTYYFYSIGKITDTDYFPNTNGFVDCTMGTTIICGKFSYTPEDFNRLPTVWENNEKDFHFYRDNNTLIIINNETNKTNIAKIWFNSEETKKFYQEVFSTGKMKVFKVK